MKQLLLISSFFVLIGCSSSEQRTQNPEVSSSYTNTKFLKNTPAVRHQLCTRDQFCPVTFTTQDDVTISALFRNNPHARATLICLAGFYPGNKEGLAVFADILPADQYNVLLVDARGHGQSEGNLWWDIAKLGTHEYRDIIAAMEFIHQETNKPIVIYGLCAGAFHALQAITHVKHAYLQALKIRGLIFDSGWATMCE
ncbi:MAG: alpha/beta fold hydrolase, partial [Candidatus Babeliales bacterium]